jgi:hypothetical protein
MLSRQKLNHYPKKGEQMNKKKLQAIAATYLRAGIASVIALYLAGVTDPKALATAGIAAIAGPLLKALDPKATEFGKTK